MLRIFGGHNGGLRRVGGLFALALCLVSASAQAQAQSDSLAPNGIKIGEGRLHPYLDIEGKVDSQAIIDPSAPAGTVRYAPDLVFNFRGGLRFDLSTPSTLFNFNGNAGASWYTGAFSSGASTRASHFITDVGLAAAFNRDGALEFQIGDQLYRGNRAQSPDVVVGAISLRNSAYVAAPIHPGGKGIEITPKVTWGVEFFTPQTSCPNTLLNCAQVLTNLNSNDLNFNINAKWRFLPKTALTVDLDYGWRAYWNVPPPPAGSTYPYPAGTSPHAHILRGLAGLTGLITSKLSLVLMAGGGGDFQSRNATFIATAELGWTPLQNLRTRLGYVRTLQPVASSGMYGDDRIYLGANMTFFRRLSINVGGAFDWLTFYGAPNAQGLVVDRSDYVISADVSPTVIITSWFNIGASYILSVRGNAFARTALPAGYTPYTRHEGVLRLTFQY